MSTASVPSTFQNAVTATGLQLDNNFTTIVAYLNDPLNRNNYAADTGNTNTVVLTFSPPVTAYSAGLEITFKVANTNTGATKLNANTVSAAPLVQPGGSDLASGQIQAGGIYKAAYNGSQWVYIGQNVLAASKGDMQTATSAITFVSPAQTQNHPGVAKAWAAWNGTITGTITPFSSYNVASIVRVGAGTYSIALTVPMVTSCAAIVQPTTNPGAGILLIGTPLTVTNTSVIALTSNFSTGAQTDATYVSFIVFGTQ